MAVSMFSLSHERGAEVLPPPGAASYASIGVRQLRYMFQWPQMQKTKGGALDFSFLDATIDNAVAAGLAVNLNPYFFPSWITGDKAVMTAYDCDCCKLAVPIPEDQAPSYCYDEVPIDEQAIRDFGAALAARYAIKVRSWSAWNEPGVRDYWLSSRDDTAESSIERWVTKAVLPFVDGVRSKLPAAQFISQFDAFCNYARALEVEASLGVSLFDVIGIHPYSDVAGDDGEIDIDATTDAVIAKVRDEFVPRIEPFKNGREIRITEIQHCDNVRLMRETSMGVNEHNPERYTDQHEAFSPSGPILVGSFAPTVEGLVLRQQLAGTRPPKHRHPAGPLEA